MHNEMVTQADHSAEVCDCRMTVSLLVIDFLRCLTSSTYYGSCCAISFMI
jgi:hypothetical protein